MSAEYNRDTIVKAVRTGLGTFTHIAPERPGVGDLVRIRRLKGMPEAAGRNGLILDMRGDEVTLKALKQELEVNVNQLELNKEQSIPFGDYKLVEEDQVANIDNLIAGVNANPDGGIKIGKLDVQGNIRYFIIDNRE